MKKLIYPGLAGFGLVLSGCSSPELMVDSNSAAVTGQSRPLAPYQCEQTRGKVRVVLLKVEHATVFTADSVQDAKPGAVYPVRTMVVSYRVDALGNEPIKTWNVNTEEITIGNHIVGSETLPANITPGASSSIGPADAVLRGAPANRSTLETIYIRCGQVPAGAATLTLKTGFNDETQTFVFENVPLN